MNHSGLFALRGQRVLTPTGIAPAVVVVRNGLIEAVLPIGETPDCPIEDVGTAVLMPGLVDTHVHINEPGRTEWEGFATATQAAAAGGITTLVDMPLNCIPVTTTRDNFLEKLSAVSDQLWVDCGFWGGVVPDSIDDLPGLLDAGVLGVKSFLIDSGVPEFPNVSPADLRRAMPIIAQYGVPYLIHAEYVGNATDQPDHPVGREYKQFLASRPDKWEVDAIELMISLASELKQAGTQSDKQCHVHIVHLSTASALGCIARARADGLNFSVETCPHYLTLCAEEVADGNTLFKCCPPIRSRDNQLRLWDAVRSGDIDFIVSDHSPCTPDLKQLASGDLGAAWGGISALQFSLPLVWQAAQAHGFNLAEIHNLMSVKPAEFAGLAAIKGKIKAGYHADLLLFDDEATFTIQPDMIRHKHKITPYQGRQVLGVVKKTWLRGQPVFDGARVSAEPQGQPLLAGQFKKG